MPTPIGFDDAGNFIVQHDDGTPFSIPAEAAAQLGLGMPGSSSSLPPALPDFNGPDFNGGTQPPMPAVLSPANPAGAPPSPGGPLAPPAPDLMAPATPQSRPLPRTAGKTAPPGLDRDYQLQEQGAAEKAQIESQAAQKMADVEKQAMDENARRIGQTEKMRQDYQAYSTKALADLDASTKALDNAQLRPFRLWQDASTAGQVAMGLSLFIGGFEQQKTGGQNLALGVLDNLMNKDIDAQKFNFGLQDKKLAAQRGLYAMNREKWGDDISATEATRVAYLDQMQKQMQAMADQFKSPAILAQAKEAIGQLEAQKDLHKANLAHQQATLQVQKDVANIHANATVEAAKIAAGAHTVAAQAAADKEQRKEDEEKAKLTVQANAGVPGLEPSKPPTTDGKPLIANDQKDHEEVTQEVQGKTDGIRRVRIMKKMVEDWGPQLMAGNWTGTAHGAAMLTEKNLFSTMGAKGIFGRVSEYELKRLDQAMGDPTSFRKDRVMAVLNTLERDMHSSVDDALAARTRNYKRGAWQPDLIPYDKINLDEVTGKIADEGEQSTDELINQMPALNAVMPQGSPARQGLRK